MKKILTAAILAIALFSCKKDPENEPYIPKDAGLLVLNEGFGGSNNASITYYAFDSATTSQDVFFRQNGRKLGDVANDILVYGGKLYIAVGGSSTLEITDLDLKSMKQISLDGTTVNAREPHSLAAHNGKIYIVCFDGKVAKLDTATLNIEQITPVGKNPEKIVISKDFAYVSNSGGLDYPNCDSTVSVIDLKTFTEIKKITVGQNPGPLGVDGNGNVIVVTLGTDYVNPNYSLHRINTATHTFDKTFSGVSPYGLAMNGSMAYIYNFNWYTFESEYVEFNTTTGAITKPCFLADPDLIEMPYSININPENEDIYISDGSGNAFVFDKTGVHRYDFETGVMPKKIVALKK